MNLTSIFTLLLIALSLSVDAFIVSLAAGIAIKKLQLGKALKIAVMFGGFQALMPIFGWFGGSFLRAFFESIEYFVVAGIFVLIGLKMLFETFLIKEEKKRDYTDFKILLVLAIATSIDAFAAGLGFSILHASIVLPVIVIGLVTLITSLVGVYIGNGSGKLFGDAFGIVGGGILIGLGIKFLLKAFNVL